MYIYLWLHLSPKRNYISFAETTSLLHRNQNVYSVWFGNMHMEKSFFNAQMKESNIKEPIKRLGNTDSKTSKFLFECTRILFCTTLILFFLRVIGFYVRLYYITM